MKKQKKNKQKNNRNRQFLSITNKQTMGFIGGEDLKMMKKQKKTNFFENIRSIAIVLHSLDPSQKKTIVLSGC